MFVYLIDNQLYLTKLLDFQIVNGGQTTASLFHTQKKFKEADLSNVFVQMKLTVIKDVEQKNIEVPNIARYANSQNKVSELDLSSNNPYFVQIESLSRKKYVIDPVVDIAHANVLVVAVLAINLANLAGAVLHGLDKLL